MKNTPEMHIADRAGRLPRKKTRLAMLLTVLLLGSGCYPSSYLIGPAISGTVVDAVTGEPLPGVKVRYWDERELTDRQGEYAFGEQSEIYWHSIVLGKPVIGVPRLDFEKDGYVPATVPGYRFDGKIALEPSYIPEGIAALDERVDSVWVMHKDDGHVLASFHVHSEDFGSLEDFAAITLDIGKKIVHSGLLGSTPDLIFRCEMERPEDRLFWRTENDLFWRMWLGWPGAYFSAPDWAARDARQWLNSVAFAFVSPEIGSDQPMPAGLPAAWEESKRKSRGYAPFLEKAKANQYASPEFSRYGLSSRK